MPLSSACGVVPLATGGGERSSAVAWPFWDGRSEIQHMRRARQEALVLYIWPRVGNFNVTTHTEVVQVDWLEGTDGLIELGG